MSQQPQPGGSQPLKATVKPHETSVLPETLLVTDPLSSGVPPEGKIVVTISRQFASNGDEVGRLVAQQSGLNYVDYQIIEGVAERLGVQPGDIVHTDEQAVPASLNHVVGAITSSSPFNINYGALSTLFTTSNRPAQNQTQDKIYLHLTQKVILDAASEGDAVIVGRGSQFLLSGRPRTLHIYVFAPMEARISNVMQSQNMSRQEAIQLIEQRDDAHDTYLRQNYGSDGHQTDLYHLLLNSGPFSCDLAASIIQQTLSVVKEMR